MMKSSVHLIDVCMPPGIPEYFCDSLIPADTRHSPNVGLVFAQRRGRWTNSNSTLVERLVYAEILLIIIIILTFMN